jgi:hypothetical protein
VLLTEGFYDIGSTTVTFDFGAMLQGLGIGTYINCSAPGGSAASWALEVGNGHVRDLSLDCGNDNHTLLRIDGGNQSDVTNCYFFAFGSASSIGIDKNTTGALTIQGCWFEGVNTGIRTGTSDDENLMIHHNFFLGNDRAIYMPSGGG